MTQGLTLDEVFVERGVSGSRPIGERPEGAKLLGKVMAGDVIITPKLDRMFRSALDALDVLARLKDRDVSLHMIDLGGDVTGNGISKLVFTILSAVAEAERDRTRERIADVKRDQKNRGRLPVRRMADIIRDTAQSLFECAISMVYADSAVSAVSLEQALACRTGCPLLARSL